MSEKILISSDLEAVGHQLDTICRLLQLYTDVAASGSSPKRHSLQTSVDAFYGTMDHLSRLVEEAHKALNSVLNRVLKG